MKQAAASTLIAAVIPCALAAQTGSGFDTVQADALRQGNALNCTIRPMRVVEVSSGLNGIVSEVMVAPGDRVEPGQPLVALDADMAQAELAVARAMADASGALQTAQTRLEGAIRREERLAEGLRRNAVSQADYDDAALQLSLAEDEVAREEERRAIASLEVERIVVQIGKSVIRSQVAGIVGEDLIDPGEGTAGRPVATIYVNRPLRVETFVPSSLLADVVARDGHEIAVEDAGGETRRIEVALDYAAQISDLASNTTSVFFTLEAEDVLPGTRCLMIIGEGM